MISKIKKLLTIKLCLCSSFDLMGLYIKGKKGGKFRELQRNLHLNFSNECPKNHSIAFIWHWFWVESIKNKHIINFYWKIWINFSKKLKDIKKVMLHGLQLLSVVTIYFLTYIFSNQLHIFDRIEIILESFWQC